MIIEKSHYEKNGDIKNDIKQHTIVQVAKRAMLKPLSITSVIIMTEPKRPLHLDPDPNHVTQGCLPAKVIAKELRNRLFTLFTDASTRTQSGYKQKVSEYLNDNITVITSTEKQLLEK